LELFRTGVNLDCFEVKFELNFNKIKICSTYSFFVGCWWFKDQKIFCFLQSDINHDFLTTMPIFLVVAVGGLKDQIFFDFKFIKE